MSTLLARALDAANLDLLLLGGLADRMRAAERGDVVRLHLDRTIDEVFINDHNDAHTFLRRIATARLTVGGPIRIDAEAVGLQLAQVALTFGADEIVVPIEKLSLEVYGNEEKKVLRERELVGLIRSAGRIARVVERGVERDPDETTPAQRRFRAPGREVAQGDA
jgi:hypothetical protein